MTENEALKIAIHCLGVQADQEVCEECPVYLDGGIACREAARVAVSALKEIQQYREIGTVEECREAKRFKEYFDELYGIGLEVANWHQDGNTEPFDNFYDAAIDWSEQNE